MGGLSQLMIKHKVVLPDEVADQELALQRDLRDSRAREFVELFERLSGEENGAAIQDRFQKSARAMNLSMPLIFLSKMIAPLMSILRSCAGN